LTLDVYRATSTFPKEEIYGLTNQLRRASASIGANIAEGCGPNTDAELARFLSIAIGSANELDYHLLLARDLDYLQSTTFDQLSAEVQAVSRMLAIFIDRLRRPEMKKLIADS
jgi:four helix bundle protein